MHDTNKKFRVVCPISKGDGKTFWRVMGVGFPNQDGSTNIILDGLPVNGKLQLRDWDEPPWQKKDDNAPRPAEDLTGSLPF